MLRILEDCKKYNLRNVLYVYAKHALKAKHFTSQQKMLSAIAGLKSSATSGKTKATENLKDVIYKTV